MNVTISVSGSFFAAYHFGRYLEEQGRLTRLINPLPYSRTRRFGVSRERTRSLWPLGGCHYLNNSFAPVRMKPWNQYALHVAFDGAASTQLAEPDIVNVWAANSLTTIRRAHRRGLKVVLHTGSTHIGWQTQTLRDEFETFGFDGALTLPALVRRAIEEYDEADAIVVPSRASLRSFLDQGVPAEKIHLIPWAGRPVTEPPEVRRRRDRPSILYVGNCSLRKGIPYLFAAFRRLQGRASLRVVGPIEKGVIECAGGVPDGVELVGPLGGESLAREYREADVFAIASIEEGSAAVVMEAMAAGLPVVVTEQVGADQVVDGVNGFVVPARDVNSFADQLARLIDDSDLRDRVGHAAVATLRQRDWRDYGADVNEVFERICREGRSSL